VADMPFPARSSVYLTTFPFTDRDVKKWAWLLSNSVEDAFLSDPGNRGGDDDEDIYGNGYPAVVRPRYRNRSPYYDPVGTTDIPSIYLSRALDTSVVPEDGKENVRYFIVVQNRARPNWSKLMVAEGRKAAGIMIYYEALTGNSVGFVGAVVGQGKRLGRVKLRKVENLEAAAKAQEEDGVVGVIC